jgi:hypothetical protein
VDFSKKLPILSTMGISTENEIASVVAKDEFLPVIQFSFLLDGRPTSLNFIAKMLGPNDLTLLALSFLENSETATVRCVVNYPDTMRKIFADAALQLIETKVMAIEISTPNDLPKVINTIFAAEVKLHYMYPFITRPNGKIGIILQTENNPFASTVLQQAGIRTISQSDIGR